MRTYAVVCIEYAREALESGSLSGPEAVDMKIIETLASRLFKAIDHLNHSQDPRDWDVASELEQIPTNGLETVEQKSECGAW